MADIPIGKRVQFYRRAAGFSQLQLAIRATVSLATMAAIEQGARTPSIDALLRLAAALGVPAASLLGEPSSEPHTLLGHPPMPAIERALMGVEAAPGAGPVEARVNAAWTVWESSPTRFTDTGQCLPPLIADTIHHVAEAGSSAQRRAAHQTAADLYFLLRAYFRQVGRLDLSLLAADRAVRAAQDADDPLRLAAARWDLGHALLASGNLDGADQVVRTAAQDLRRSTSSSTPAVEAMYGALHLVAAVAIARAGRRSGAERLVDDVAAPRARAFGETPLWGIWFGPANVGLHTLALTMEAHRTAEALSYAPRIPIAGMGSIERRSRYCLDLARCHEQQGDDQAALRWLLRAEREAPEDIYGKPLARDMVRSLLKRPAGRLPEVRSLAKRLQVARR
jgi:transcriptional regulator with XRE-family HTH domain